MSATVENEEEIIISQDTEGRKFKGSLGPLEDEIHIRKMAEKYKNTPIFSGAFYQVLIIKLV